MAKLKAVLESLDGLDESLQGFYTESADGKFRLDAEGVEDVSGLKSALAKEKKRRQDLESQVPDGFNPDEYKQMKADREKLEREQLEAKGRWDQLEKQLVGKYEQRLTDAQKEKDGVQNAMERYLIDAAAASELAKHSDTPKLLMPHIKSVMKVVQEDGQYHARVIDPTSGTVRVSPKGQGSTPMDLSELIDEMKQSKDYAPAFRGTGSSGSGATRSVAGGGNSKTIAAGDDSAFLANLDGILKGEVNVGMP